MISYDVILLKNDVGMNRKIRLVSFEVHVSTALAADRMTCTKEASP